MIINVKNGKDIITLDFQLNQIRYCRNIAKHGRIEYLDFSELDLACYKILYDDDRPRFFSCLAEDMESYVNKRIDPTKLEVLTTEGYCQAVAQ